MNCNPEEMSVTPTHTILIVEDDKEECALISRIISTPTTKVDTALDGAAAINNINHQLYDLILLDLHLPRVTGMEVLAHVKSYAGITPVIILTGSMDVRSAVEAMKCGAYDYLTKPFTEDELKIVMARALEFRSLRNSVTLTERSREWLMDDENVIGESEVWLDTLFKARQFAISDSPVYVEGETGSGKEVVAKYIHRFSERKEKPFVAVDCGVLPDSLIESELFGYKKGAFTGADSSKEGLVELAMGGTLFLDEIGHIDMRFQQKLLKFVETKSLRRVGDIQERVVDVRIIAATNKNLEKECEEGRFRNDLWFRINGLRLRIPPLRHRVQDIPLMVEHYLKKFQRNRNQKIIFPEALSAMESYSWPGNIRELQSVIERAVTTSASDEVITLKDLDINLEYNRNIEEEIYKMSDSMSLREVERKHIVHVLRAVNWNISRAAKTLNIGRTTLYDKINAYQIKQLR